MIDRLCGLLLLLFSVVACGGARSVEPTGAALSTPRRAEPQERWAAKLDVDHPLVGRVWDVENAAFVMRDVLWARLGREDYVLLGEKHDNPDHHRLQALVLRALVARQKHPTLAFEMIEVDQQPRVDTFLKDRPTSAAGLGAAVGWDDRGWPTWGDYEPIAQAAIDAHLPIVAANLPHAEARAIVHEGLSALEAARVKQLGLDKPLAAEDEASLNEELRLSHCGHLPEAMTAAMALTQRARDATMAAILLEDHGRGAVLIAGAGHVRSDRGVPWALRAQKPGARVASLAFVEVEHALAVPQAYAARFGAKTLPFAYVWFTPRANDDDPCEKFRKKP